MLSISVGDVVLYPVRGLVARLSALGGWLLMVRDSMRNRRRRVMGLWI